MASEQLIQAGYITTGGQLRGATFGNYEKLIIGQTTVDALHKYGLVTPVPTSINFPFTIYRPPVKGPSDCKPDNLFISRQRGYLEPVAVMEMKTPLEFNTEKKENRSNGARLVCGGCFRRQGSHNFGREYVHLYPHP